MAVGLIGVLNPWSNSAAMRLNALSPLDGRYADQLLPIASHFSEQALIRSRVEVEIRYLLALAEELGVSLDERAVLTVLERFDDGAGSAIKAIERTTRHDVKAVEYWLKEQLQPHLGEHLELIHFALTSEDVNNLSYALMHQAAVKQVLLPTLARLLNKLSNMARNYRDAAMLSRTHGQPASPTTMGKELGVFASRLASETADLHRHILRGKFGGATGTLAALTAAYPGTDWLAFSRRFISSFGLEPSPVTTQVEPADRYAALYDNIRRINRILFDLSQDMWLYVSDGYFSQRVVAGEVGSSAMPHKVNPIDFENAEGNLGVANALLTHLGEKLAVSRLQRDLSGSTVMRNAGVAIGHSYLAWLSVARGLERVALDRAALQLDLEAHPEILAEAIQTVLRAEGHEVPYERLKALTRGRAVTLTELRELAQTMSPERETFWLSLTPASYIGVAPRLADEAADFAEGVAATLNGKAVSDRA